MLANGQANKQIKIQKPHQQARFLYEYGFMSSSPARKQARKAGPTKSYLVGRVPWYLVAELAVAVKPALLPFHGVALLNLLQESLNSRRLLQLGSAMLVQSLGKECHAVHDFSPPKLLTIYCVNCKAFMQVIQWF